MERQSKEIKNTNRENASTDKIDALFQRLVLRDEETTNIVLEEDVNELRAESKWMAIGKLYTTKSFSHGALFNQMRQAWSLAKEVKFQALGENLFAIQFFCKGDWEKVLRDGPWLFRGNAFLVEMYDGITRPSAVQFAQMAVWVRICDFPPTFRKESVAKQLGDRIGAYLKMDDREGWGNFFRIRVKLDLTKPLIRVVPVAVKGINEVISQSFEVKYEKLPRFCSFCGLIGHLANECGDGDHSESDMQYGDFLIASPDRRANVKSIKTFPNSSSRDEFSTQSSHEEKEGNKTMNTKDVETQDDANSQTKLPSKELTVRKRLLDMLTDPISKSSSSPVDMAIVFVGPGGQYRDSIDLLDTGAKGKGMYKKQMQPSLLGQKTAMEVESVYSKNTKVTIHEVSRDLKRQRKDDEFLPSNTQLDRSAGSMEGACREQ